MSSKIDRLAVEVGGRLAAMETILLTQLVKTSALHPVPSAFIADVMDNAETLLRRGLAEAEQRAEVEVALATFARFSEALLRHIAKAAGGARH